MCYSRIIIQRLKGFILTRLLAAKMRFTFTYWAHKEAAIGLYPIYNIRTTGASIWVRIATL